MCAQLPRWGGKDKQTTFPGSGWVFKTGSTEVASPERAEAAAAERAARACREPAHPPRSTGGGLLGRGTAAELGPGAALCWDSVGISSLTAAFLL